MSNQYGESSPGGEQSWGRGGWPQPGNRPPDDPPRGTYGQPTPPPADGQPGGYGQPPYGGPPDYGPPGPPYEQPPTGYQTGPDLGGGYGYGYGYGAPPYAGWVTRVGSYLVDALPTWVLIAIGATLLGRGGAGAAVGLVFYLAALGWVIYNRWYRAGTTGQSLGKSATNVRLISERTGQPIGGGMAFVRDLCHIADAIICYVGFLFPLWDDKRQTLADKIVSTVVVRNDSVPPPGHQPPGRGWQ